MEHACQISLVSSKHNRVRDCCEPQLVQHYFTYRFAGLCSRPDLVAELVRIPLGDDAVLFGHVLAVRQHLLVRDGALAGVARPLHKLLRCEPRLRELPRCDVLLALGVRHRL